VRERIADWKLAVSRQQQEQTIIGARNFTQTLLQDSGADVKHRVLKVLTVPKVLRVGC